MNVYQCINAVQAELVKVGITKDRKATGFGAGYNFRGIDDVYNTLSPILAQHGLVIIPRCLERVQSERASGDKKLYFVAVKMEFDFVSSHDNTSHTACTFGEAMDSGDKATNKAMSIAYKYACFQTFAIPTEGDNDPDGTVHQPERVKQQQAAPAAKTAMTAEIMQQAAGAVKAGKATVQAIAKKYDLTDAQRAELIKIETAALAAKQEG
jgi:hypothetical protein